MRMAAQAAQQQGRLAVLRLDPAAGTYTLSFPATRSALLPTPPESALRTWTLPRGVRVTAAPGAATAADGTLRIVFPPSGVAPAVTIQLRDGAGTLRTLFVHPITHVLRIVEGHRTPEQMLSTVKDEEFSM